MFCELFGVDGVKNKLYLVFSVLFCIATLFMGVGYASINSISLNINGEMTAQVQDGIFITEINYVEKENLELVETYEIDYTNGTTLKSKITLEENNLESEISLKLSFYNSNDFDCIFTDIVYAEENNMLGDIYSNYDIVYTFDNQNKIISKNGGTLDVTITFKYDQISEYTSNVLDSILNFKFKKLYNVTYNNISNTDDLPVYGIENETLTIDFSELDYYYFAIFMGENKLVLNEDYTFENRILEIFNVNGDLKIGTFGAVTNGLITLANQYTNTSSIYGDFKVLPKNSDLSNSLGSCTWADCYSDNNGKFEYDSNGGLVFDSNNQIGILSIDDSMKIDDQYTVYITLKANVNQVEPNGKYSTAAIAMSENGSPYLIWLGFYKGYLHIYSFKSGNKDETNKNLSEEGFLSMNASAYSSKIINIQITASRGNKTKLYINGELIKTFTSGSVETTYSQATLGDLRPGRGLKFQGVIYDVALYNRVLSADEVTQNWNYANEVWSIE